MKIKEIKYIADIEMMRDGYLSKGVRLEVISAAKSGEQFSLEVSTDDYIRIGAELRRSGHTGCMTASKSKEPNRKIVNFNQSK